MEFRIVYFDNPGKDNTEEVFRIARRRAEELGIRTILVASTTGETAVRAMDALKGLRIIIVAHSAGFREPNTQEFSDEHKKIVESKGSTILFTTHAFGGLSRAMRQSSIPEARTTYIIGDIVAMTLRIFGQGMKVVCEIAAMAADSGLVRTDEEVIVIAGTGAATEGGADTAVVMQPANLHLLFDMQIKEILCKPRNLQRVSL
jgi:hypothetical protein